MVTLYLYKITLLRPWTSLWLQGHAPTSNEFEYPFRGAASHLQRSNGVVHVGDDVLLEVVGPEIHGGHYLS